MLVNQIDELLDTSFSSPKLFVQNNLLNCLPHASLLNVREFATSENYLWQIFKNLKQELKNCENKITIYSQLEILLYKLSSYWLWLNALS